MELAPSLTLNSFIRICPLGRGAYGSVYLARHLPELSTTPIALKIIPKRPLLSSSTMGLVTREKEILETLNHPSLVKYYSSFQDEDNIYFVLEFVCGGELLTRMRESSIFPPEIARFYTVNIVESLLYLHSEGICYRDLKPENVLLDHSGYTKLIDFGLAKRIDGRTYTMCGTNEYLAPEVVLGRTHGKEVDWWALGILLFEMLTGKSPFYSENPNEIYQKILNGKFEVPKHFEETLKSFMKQLLCVNVKRRLCGEQVFSASWMSGHDVAMTRTRSFPAPWVPSAELGLKGDYFLPSFENFTQEVSVEC